MPSDDTLYLYTSLTAGSSHIITATSRIETILKANKIPFKAIDCATDDKARMLWARRSKGRKIPGLVKFNDVIADLEQVEEWNEYGELEEQIEDQIDIFGDVPISATAAEAQAAAAARTQAQEEAKKAAQSGTGRTASETRHISISEPKEEGRKGSESAASQDKKDTPLSMAMRQAGAEAAAKAGQMKTAKPVAATSATTKAVPVETTSESKIEMPPPTAPASATVAAPKLDTDAVDPITETTDAKTPDMLAAEGAKKVVTDKINATATQEEGDSTKSTPAQIIDQRRKSSVPVAPSSLAKSTSIDEDHTVKPEPEKSVAPATAKAATSATKPAAKPASTPAAANDEDDDDEDDDDEDEDDDDDDDEDDSEDDEATRPTKAAKISATSKEEEKILKGTKPQETGAKDASKAGVSVAD